MSEGLVLNTGEVQGENVGYVVRDVEITLGTAGQRHIANPFEGELVKVFGALNGSLSTGDETLTIKDSAGNTLTTVTLVQSASAEGDVFESQPVTKTVSKGQNVEIETDGGNGSSPACMVTLVFKVALHDYT